MLTNIREVQRKPPWSGVMLVYDVLCDFCGKSYEMRNRGSDKDRHDFCSRECKHQSQKSGGALSEKIRCTCLSKYGVDRPSKSEAVKEKAKNTCIVKYGVEFTSQVPESREKTKKTLVSRYGVEHALQSEECREKFKKTSIEHFGTEHPNQSPRIREKISATNSSVEIREKREQTCLKKYGVISPMKSDEVKEKLRCSFLKKYGVECPFQVDSVKAKIRETNLERYGCEIPMNSSVVRDKRRKSLKSKGKFGKSCQEDELYSALCDLYGSFAVERHVDVNGWDIDFYVNTIDVYIQHDGSYYHGLDRPIEVIKEFRTETDKTIYRTFLRDLEQNKYFDEHNMTLVRVIDYKEGQKLDHDK